MVHPISQAPKLFFLENNLFYGIYDICNSISAYGKRGSLGADPGFFQRGGCKYEFKANVPGPKECGRGGGKIRIRYKFEALRVQCSNDRCLSSFHQPIQSNRLALA